MKTVTSFANTERQLDKTKARQVSRHQIAQNPCIRKI